MILKILNNLKNKLWLTMSHNKEDAEPYFPILGWVLIISYLGFYFFNSLIAAPGGYENLYLRLLVSFFGLMLILYNYLPSLLKKYFPLLFYFILLFSFPFFFTFMLLKNQEYSAWQVKELVGLVLLSFFVDYISFIILTILGVAGAIICTGYTNYETLISLGAIFGSFSAPVIYFLIFSKKRTQLEDERKNYLVNIKELNDSLENKVNTRTAELQQALAAKTELLNNVSHEIRTPIQGFTVMSHGLYSQWDEFDELKRRKLALQVAKNAERLSVFLSNLLDLSKFTSGKMILDIKKINLENLVKNIIKECNELYLDQKQLKLELISCNDTSFIADAEKIEQVLRNLFINAIKFSYDNSVVTASIEHKNIDKIEMLEFVITNFGVGITQSELEDIFEPFIQGTLTKNKAGGTGLGLSICKKIIESHHGKIWAVNNNDSSISFHFLVPIKS